MTGGAFQNYVCEDVPLSWVDVTPGTRLNGTAGDDSFATLAIGPFLGVAAMGRLRLLPEATRLAGGRR